MGKNARQSLGRWGEEFAARYLSNQGYTILTRNAHTEYGEIDLVARQKISPGSELNSDAAMIVFVEVKTRSTTAYGMPEAGISKRKIEHMLASAQAYLQEHPELEDDWRIDVIAIRRPRAGGKPQITHFENAIT
jgi:putative endonuclease